MKPPHSLLFIPFPLFCGKGVVRITAERGLGEGSVISLE